MPITAKNLWFYIYLKLFFLSACFALSFGLFPIASKATTIYDQDFDGYSDRSLNGTDSWTRYNNDSHFGAMVVDNQIMATTTAVESYTDTNWYRTFTSFANGSECFDINFNSTYTNFQWIYVKANSYVDFQTSDEFGGLIGIHNLAYIQPSTWHHICINLHGASSTYDLVVDDYTVIFNHPANIAFSSSNGIEISPVPIIDNSQEILIDNIVITDTFATTSEQEVEIIELPDDSTTVWVFDDDHKIQVNDQYCFYDTLPCQINFKFHPDLIGQQIYLLSTSTIVATTIARIGNINFPTYYNHFDLNESPTPEVEQDYVYTIAWVENGNYYSTQSFNIAWYSSTSTKFADMVINQMEMAECNRMVLKWRIQCTSTSTWDCIFQNFGNWLFAPNEDACLRLNDAKENFLLSFPFNVATQIVSTVNQASSSDQDIIIPLRMWQKDTQSFETIGTLLSTSTLQLGMGDYLYDEYYLWTQRFIWLAGFMIIFFRIFSRMSPRDARIYHDPILANKVYANKVFKHREDVPVINLKK